MEPVRKGACYEDVDYYCFFIDLRFGVCIAQIHV